MNGILADNNVIGQVAHLVQLMQAEPWGDFWKELGLALRCFDDVGLAPDATDVEIWQCCLSEKLVLITDNRNADSPDSLTAAIRNLNTPDCLPVFTIADLKKFGKSREYEERVLATLYNYLFRIDEVRGAGRLYLP